MLYLLFPFFVGSFHNHIWWPYKTGLTKNGCSYKQVYKNGWLYKTGLTKNECSYKQVCKNGWLYKTGLTKNG